MKELYRFLLKRVEMTDQVSSGGELISIKIVEKVAKKSGRDPLDLPPLQQYIDTQGLEAAVESARIKNQNEGQIEFSYLDYQITVPFNATQEISVTKTSVATTGEE
jgi:hypothetical protein